MQGYDPKKAAEVWQRVQSTARPEGPDTGLLPLIAAELSASATYMALSKRFTGKESVLLRTMAEEEASHAACLKGMYRLQTGQVSSVQATPPGAQQTLESALRRCYAGELGSIHAYESRSAQPEYGHIFARMAREEENHSRTVLELLGRLQQK